MRLKIIFYLFTLVLVLFIVGCSQRELNDEMEAQIKEELNELNNETLLDVSDEIDSSKSFSGQATKIRGELSNYNVVSRISKIKMINQEMGDRLKDFICGVKNSNDNNGDVSLDDYPCLFRTDSGDVTNYKICKSGYEIKCDNGCTVCFGENEKEANQELSKVFRDLLSTGIVK